MYELMVIGNPKTDTEQVLALVDKTLKEANAKDVKIDKLGRKNLTFPISKQTEGEYMVFNFEAEGDKVAQIGSKLRLEQETILRYLITSVKVSKRPFDKSRGEQRAKETKATTTQASGIQEGIEKVSEIEDTDEKPVAKIEVKADTKGAKVSKRTKVTKVAKGTKVEAKKRK